MKRTALKRKTGLKRGGDLKRKSRLNPVNRKRKARLYERNFGDHAEWIRQMPCAITGAPPPNDPHHTKRRGMGGCGGDKRHLVPLCRFWNEELERNHYPEHEEMLSELAAELWARSPHRVEE